MILRIICIIFVTGTGVFADETNPFVDDDVEKQCNTICSSNRSEYVPENGVCRCFLDQQIDNTELLFMSKNANLLGLSLEIITPDNGIITIQPKILTTNTEITTNEPLITTTIRIDDNSDEMVAQSQMHPPILYHHHHRPLQPITQDQQQLLLKQIRDRLNRLSLTTDPRIRQAELHGIRTTLRQLSRSSLLQRPQIRPRIATDQLRNMIGQARIQSRMRLMSNRLGATPPKINNTNEEILVETTPMELEDFSITTQPTELLQEGE